MPDLLSWKGYPLLQKMVDLLSWLLLQKMFDLTKNVKHFLSSQAFFEVKATTTGLHFLFQKDFFEGITTTTG